MKTDTIFYSLFQAFPSIFFELINQPPTEAGTYEFTSREVKQLAFRLEANSGFTKRAISGIREFSRSHALRGNAVERLCLYYRR